MLIHRMHSSPCRSPGKRPFASAQSFPSTVSYEYASSWTRPRPSCRSARRRRWAPRMSLCAISSCKVRDLYRSFDDAKIHMGLVFMNAGALDHEVTLHIPLATSPSSSETTPEYSCNLRMSCWFATLRTTSSSSSSPVASPTAVPQPPSDRQRLFTCHPSWLQALCRHLHDLNHLLQVHASSSSSSSTPSSPLSSSAACDDSKEDSKPLVEGDAPTKDSGDSAQGSADSHEDEQKEEHSEVVAEDHQTDSIDAQMEATVPPLPPRPPSLWRDGDEDEDFYAVV